MPFKPKAIDYERIRVFGELMLEAAPSVTALLCVDADYGKYTGKGDWYEQQLKEKYPALIIVERFNGPTPLIHSIKVESPPFRKRPSND